MRISRGELISAKSLRFFGVSYNILLIKGSSQIVD